MTWACLGARTKLVAAATAGVVATITERNGEQRHAVHLQQPADTRVCVGRISDLAGPDAGQSHGNGGPQKPHSRRFRARVGIRGRLPAYVISQTIQAIQ